MPLCSSSEYFPAPPTLPTQPALPDTKNQRLSEQITTTARQQSAPPLNYRIRIYGVSTTGFTQRPRTTIRNFNWYAVPHHGPRTLATTTVLPQQDLQLLEQLQSTPVKTILAYAATNPRPPTPGPLVTAEVTFDTYWHTGQTTRILIATGLLAILAAFLFS